MYKCVYCSAESITPFEEEHVVPRALGKFLLEGKEVVLTDRVCSACNTEVGKCDAEIAYAGPESMFRLKVGVKGRKRKKKENPYYKNRFAVKPVVTTGKRSDKGDSQRLEMDRTTGSATHLRSLTFRHPDTGETVTIPLTKEMTRDEFLAQLKDAGYPGGNHAVEVFCDIEDEPWVEKLFGPDANRIKWNHVDPNPEEIATRSEFTITDRYQGGIAKIAFNHLMFFHPLGITGYENELASLWDFIRNGAGHPNHFVQYSKKQIISGTGHGRALEDYGHIVTSSIDNLGITGLVQLFTGRDHDQGHWRVKLGRYPFRVTGMKERIGHWFRITSDRNHPTDDGVVIPLIGSADIILL